MGRLSLGRRNVSLFLLLRQSMLPLGFRERVVLKANMAFHAIS